MKQWTDAFAKRLEKEDMLSPNLDELQQIKGYVNNILEYAHNMMYISKEAHADRKTYEEAQKELEHFMNLFRKSVKYLSMYTENGKG